MAAWSMTTDCIPEGQRHQHYCCAWVEGTVKEMCTITPRFLLSFVCLSFRFLTRKSSTAGVIGTVEMIKFLIIFFPVLLTVMTSAV